MRRARLLAGLALTLPAAGCAGERPEPPPGGGRPPVIVRVNGSPLLVPLMAQAARRFEASERGVEVEVRRSGTEEGFDALCAGTAPIALASRAIRSPERRLCRENGNIVRAVPLANEGLAVVAHPALDLDCMTTAELAKLWRAGSRVETYRDLAAGLPEERVSAVGLRPGSESFSFFTRAVTGAEGSVRGDFAPANDSTGVLRRVASTPGAVGFVGYAALQRGPRRVSPVAIDDGAGCVLPSRRTVQTHAYAPLSRALDAYVSLEGLRVTKVQAFLAFAVDRRAELAEAAGVVPIDAAQAARARRVVGEPRPPQARPAER